MKGGRSQKNYIVRGFIFCMVNGNRFKRGNKTGAIIKNYYRDMGLQNKAKSALEWRYFYAGESIFKMV